MEIFRAHTLDSPLSLYDATAAAWPRRRSRRRQRQLQPLATAGLARLAPATALPAIHSLSSPRYAPERAGNCSYCGHAALPPSTRPLYRSFRAMQRLCCAVRSTARPWCTSPAPHRADAHAFARRRRRLASRSVLDEDEVDRSRFNVPSRSVCCISRAQARWRARICAQMARSSP